MRVAFQKTPGDLIAALVYTTVASLAILTTSQGTLWALLLVMFFPGYVVVAALFPGQGLASRLRGLLVDSSELRTRARAKGMSLERHKRVLIEVEEAARTGRLADANRILEDGNERLREALAKEPDINRRKASEATPHREGEESGGESIDGVERITLSFGLSIAIVSLLGLALNFTPWGIRLDSIVVTLLLFTLFVGFIAIRRRMRLPVVDRLSVTIDVRWPSSAEHSAIDKVLTALLAASIIFAVATVVHVIVTPRPTERFTQLYILDRNGGITDYPFSLNRSEPGTVIIVVVNNESARINYTVAVDLEGVQFVQNETIVVNRTTVANNASTLDDRRVWAWPFTFAIANFGHYKLDFLLYRDENFAQPYRNTFLFVNVTGT